MRNCSLDSIQRNYPTAYQSDICSERNSLTQSWPETSTAEMVLPERRLQWVERKTVTAQSTAKVIPERSKFPTVKSLIQCSRRTSLYVWRRLGKRDVERIGQAKAELGEPNTPGNCRSMQSTHTHVSEPIYILKTEEWIKKTIRS